MDAEQIISRMVQIGTVSVVDSSKHAVRVIFKQSGESSGWLKVLQHIGGALDIVPDAQHTHNISCRGIPQAAGFFTIAQADSGSLKFWGISSIPSSIPHASHT